MAKPKFELEWTKSAKATYKVNAKTYEEVYDFFKKRKAKKQEWGTFALTPNKPQVSWEGDPIKKVVLKIGFTITMPVWSHHKDAPKKCQAAWDKMYQKLEHHEAGHWLVVVHEAEEFGKKVEQEGLDKKQLQSLLKQLSADIEKAQKKYDQATGHGEKDGVFLPAPDKCK